MKNIRYILIVFIFFSCVKTNLFKEYVLYRRDISINYPKEKLSLKFISDTTGLFINTNNKGDVIIQRFNFIKLNNDYLIVERVVPICNNLISLKPSDTIIIDKSHLHFFYIGDKKYLLSFKKGSK